MGIAKKNAVQRPIKEKHRNATRPRSEKRGYPTNVTYPPAKGNFSGSGFFRKCPSLPPRVRGRALWQWDGKENSDFPDFGAQ